MEIGMLILYLETLSCYMTLYWTLYHLNIMFHKLNLVLLIIHCYNVNYIIILLKYELLGTQLHLSKFLFHSTDGTSANSIEEDEYSASTLIEKANRNLGKAA